MAVGDVASFDATQINALPENPLLRLNNEFESLVVHQYVPPIVAPMQEAQVFTGPNLGGTSQQRKPTENSNSNDDDDDNTARSSNYISYLSIYTLYTPGSLQL